MESPQLDLDSPLYPELQRVDETLWVEILDNEQLTQRVLEKCPASVSTLNLRIEQTIRGGKSNDGRLEKTTQLLLEKGMDFSLSDAKGLTPLLHLCTGKRGTYSFNFSKVYPVIQADFFKKVAKIRQEPELQFLPQNLMNLIMTYRGVADYFCARDHRGNNILHILTENQTFKFDASTLDQILLETGIEALMQKNRSGETPFMTGLRLNKLDFSHYFIQKLSNKKAIEEAYTIFQTRIHPKNEKTDSDLNNIFYAAWLAIFFTEKCALHDSIEKLFKDKLNLPAISDPS